MPRHLFSVLSILLLLLGCAYFADGASEKTVKKYKSLFFAGGNGVLIGLSEAWYTESDKGYIDIAARYTDMDKRDWKKKRALQKKEEKTEEEKQEAREKRRKQRGESDHDEEEDEEEKEKMNFNHYALRNPTAVIKGNKAYLAALYKRFVGDEYYVDLAIGDIMSEGANKVIKWNRSESLIPKLLQEIEQKELNVFPGSNNSAFLTSKGTIVFSANATNKKGKWGYAIMQLKDDEKQWEVSFVEKPEGCRRFSLFDWKEKLTTLFSGCSTDTPYVKEYDEVKMEWNDADDTPFHMWRDKNALIDVIPVTIENKSLLLFIEKYFVVENGVSKLKIFLGVSNGIRMFHFEWLHHVYLRVDSGKLLYINGELFFLFEGFYVGWRGFVFKPFEDQMETIKSTLKTWDKNDAYLSRPCSETVPEGASLDTFCVTPVPTNGLISFFSDRADELNKTSGLYFWTDEYLLLTTRVYGAKKVTNGFMLDKGKESINIERYNFMKYGLTVVATMIVHETPKTDCRLLTVEKPWQREFVGLWYKGGQWKVVSDDVKEEPAMDLETQKEYRVALIVQDNTISAYVNGKSLGGTLPASLSEGRVFSIEKIIIAHYDHCDGMKLTVTNALLYNRALNDTELEALSKTIPPETLTDSRKTTEGQTDSKKTTEGQTDSEKTPKTPTNPEDSSVSVRMGVTPLFLLGSFCLAVFW